MSTENKNLDDLEKQFEKLDQFVNNLYNNLFRNTDIPIRDLFPPIFMEKYTSFLTFEELLESGGFHVNTQEDFKAIPDDQFDAHVSKNSKFSSWEDMMQEAIRQYVKKKIES